MQAQLDAFYTRQEFADAFNPLIAFEQSFPVKVDPHNPKRMDPENPNVAVLIVGQLA